MDFSLYEIGAFQFENLVRNRIPFILLNLTEPVTGLFASFQQSYLDNQTVATTPGQALAALRERNLPTEQAIVILCADGQDSRRALAQIIDAGYSNAFIISGGARQLKQDLH